MASDEDYMNFLNKANEDASGGGAATQASGQSKFKTTDSGKQVPQAIQKAIKNEVYVTDADEPFEGVALKWTGDGGLPDEEEFAKLIAHPNPSTADIEIMDPTDWDTNGQYNKIVDAVREATKGADVRVYRVKRDGTRTEYWVVSSADGGIVGAKALGVES
ncbi:hypothetical protein NLU13_6373 [Sarocladium strictum]|uniref:Uncharacterized protein n=1 Tax=Sarocladium strictum TaxID=5046 RepID=A0AA39L720_SARSR|nr:hypothetical protein NLU13_6373 [Sarocladium strictum]